MLILNRTIMSKSPVIIFVLFLSFSCSIKQDQSFDELIHVDVIKAFEKQKSFKASEFIEDVEFVPLETSVDSYFKFSEYYSVGNKYILVTDTERAHIILFDRNGIFIRNIGTKGKGPGEIGYPQVVTLSPDENYLYVYESRINKLVKFSVRGEFIKEISTKEIFEVTRENSCFLTTENKPFGFDNDLFAIGDIFFRDYNPQNECPEVLCPVKWRSGLQTR